MRPIVALSLPITLSYPGKPVAISEITPKPTEWWLRPVMSAARVGEHSAVEQKLVKRSPLAATRSSVGVGTTPPKVDGALKPTSSVMMSRIFGAPFGGTTRAGQAGLDCNAFSSISPWNRCGGAGRYLPSIVVVAHGDPGGHAGSCASAAANPMIAPITKHTIPLLRLFISSPLCGIAGMFISPLGTAARPVNVPATWGTADPEDESRCNRDASARPSPDRRIAPFFRS